MKTLLASTALSVVCAAGVASAQDCGSVSIANMNVQSAEILANIDKIILEEGYDCDVSLVPGDTVPTGTSMVEKGDPDLSPETWVDLLPEIIPRGLEEGKIVQGAPALHDGGVQGWWIPKYVADAHPDIKTVDDALAHPELFPHPDDPSQGAIFNGAQGWGATVVTGQLFKAYDAANKGFGLVEPGSAAGLDGLIARAYEREQGFITYYWAPTGLLAKYPLVKLEASVEHDTAEWTRCITVVDCPDPKVSAWPVDRVYSIMTKSFSESTSPEVVKYLDTRSWGNEKVAEILAWMTDNQATGEDAAYHFLEENADIWTPWVSPDAAEKISSAL